MSELAEAHIMGAFQFYVANLSLKDMYNLLHSFILAISLLVHIKGLGSGMRLRFHAFYQNSGNVFLRLLREFDGVLQISVQGGKT